MKKRFFISNAIDDEKLPFISAEEMKFGKAHYSWKVVADLYRRGLEAAGIETRITARPEIYQSKIAQEIFGVRHDDVHLAIKPIEHIRPFFGMKNIFIGGWEFPEFSHTSYGGNPLFDQINTFKHADQIWCWSDFTASNIKSYGINTAITMPPPVIVPKATDEKSILQVDSLTLDTTRVPRPDDVKPIGDTLSLYKGDSIFLSVLNPFDKRKQFKSMLTAFQSALNQRPNIVLIVKLVIDNEVTRLVNIQELLDVHHDFQGKSDRIIFISEQLTDSQMIKLAQLANFYLCTSSTEGLNLPMIEAMAQGVVPVSTNATAMADYIHGENAIVVEYEKSTTDGAYHFLHNYLPTTHFPPSLSSVTDSLILAADMPVTRYKSLSNRAKKDVNDKYSVQAFINKLNAIG
ncbi:glycosyltransferase [Comamonas testosteroni]|uniref:glycosyltransferase n=1 Tax=Comamonas testosteroni TaxID=285 RepID=UPI0009BB87FC|nr:glycosyltransferase [Comamonas testosteroni]